MAPSTDTQQRIIEAASELIYARSYADVGVAEICERAGVQKGSFYHFFASKGALMEAVLDAHYERLKTQLLDRAFAADLPPLGRLKRFAKLAYAFQKGLHEELGAVLGCPAGNLANEVASHDEPLRMKLAALFKRIQNEIRDVVKEALDAGDIKDANAEATAQAMFAYFEGVMLLAKTQNDPSLLRKLLPAMADIRIGDTRSHRS